MVDEHETPQNQDELSEDQLADVSGGFLGGDPDRPVIVGVVSNDGYNKNPNEPQQGIQDGTSNTIMLK
jgi:hypothetical protein